MLNKLYNLRLSILIFVSTFFMISVRVPTTVLNIIVSLLFLYSISFLVSSLFEKKMNFIKNPRVTIFSLLLLNLTVIQLIRHSFTPAESFNMVGKLGAYLLSDDILIMMALGCIVVLVAFLCIYRLSYIIFNDVKLAFATMPDAKKELDNLEKRGVISKNESKERWNEAKKITDFLGYVNLSEKMLKLSYYFVTVIVTLFGIIKSWFFSQNITSNSNEVLSGTFFGSLIIIIFMSLGTIVLFNKSSKNNYRQ